MLYLLFTTFTFVFKQQYGFGSGTVALVQRGTCPFGVKAANAQTAGASAVIVFNNVEGPLNGTLGAPGVTVPVIGVPTILGRELAATGTTVIAVSSELPELIGMSDRVLIMHEGRISGEARSEDADEELLLAYCYGKAVS